jgi:predicted O-methyltransferase YrrM
MRKGDAMTIDELPPLVARANALAREMGFPLTRQEAAPGGASACLPGVGVFLAVLAAGCHGGRIAEAGTGVGVGAAWMASAMPAGCTLVTVESDGRLAAAAAALLAADDRVEVVHGDAWAVLPARGPFDLLFADGGTREQVSWGGLVDLLAVGGRLVADDVTPVQALPPDSPLLGDDPKRRLFSSDPRLVSAEVVLPDLQNSLLVGTRRATGA